MPEKSFGDVSWDDESVQYDSGDLRDKRYRGEEGRVDRFSILQSQAFMVMQHWVNSASRYVRCRQGESDGCPGCEQLGEPRPQFHTHIVLYRTNRAGAPVTPVQFEIKIWSFGADKFAYLRNIRKEWGDLRKVDLQVACSDTQYQRMTLTPCKTCLWNDDKELMKNVASAFKEQRVDFSTLHSKVLSRAEMLTLLGGTVGASPPPVSDDDLDTSDEEGGEVDFDEILEDLEES